MKADPSIKEDCTYRLGNMCLLIAGENRNIGRMPFANKRTVYLNTEIQITQEVGKHTTWDRAKIEECQKHLADLAVSTWRFQ